MRKSLWHYAVLFHPEDDDTRLVVGPAFVLADKEETVRFIAIREVPDEYTDTPDRLEVLVSPFA